jgi:hypothetical protein
MDMLKAKFRIPLIVAALIVYTLFPGDASTFWQLKDIIGVKWDDVYGFDKSNVFKIEFYAKNKELMQTINLKTCYQSTGDNFVTRMEDARGGFTENVLDKKNKVAIQITASRKGAKPDYNAGKFKYPTETELQKLDIVPTNETKSIAGVTCKKYTYTLKNIFGEVWITDQINLPNDLGVFRAAKMAAKHNTLSASGFVMEMTSEDSGGGKTLMTTLSLKNNESYTLDLKSVKMGIFTNTVNYYLY